jgi:endonuclease/exonuclease/phosphatase family metal-dependent hydrolase
MNPPRGYSYFGMVRKRGKDGLVTISLPAYAGGMLRFLFFCLLACPVLAAPPLEVRVMSFNLRYITLEDVPSGNAWIARRDTAAAVIKEDGADFVGVQEAFRLMLDDVKARVPGLAETGVGREDGKEKGEYSAILYREKVWELQDRGTFWLSDTPEVAGSATWGNTVTRICSWGKFRHRAEGREVWVYNAHFDHQSQPAREKGAALILKRIQERGGEAPVIFMGDLNAAPENGAIKVLQEGPPVLTDAWRAVNAAVPAAESGTFHRFTGRKDFGRIDYIFTTAHWEIKEAAILHPEKDGKYPSDHWPVRATLRLK